MAQRLRITFEGKDHSIELINPELLHQQSEEVVVIYRELTLTLVRTGSVWVPKSNEHTDLIGLAAAIGRTLALRYRI